MTLLATGPLTNVAEALGRDPSLAGRLEMVYAMGGAVSVGGNVRLPGTGGKAEWNFFVDPRAARVVLSSGVPVTLVPLDATNRAPVTVALTRPPPEEPSTSIWPSSSCMACIFDCSCAACFIMPRKSGIACPLEVVV